MMKFSNIQWVVQQNLSSEDTTQAIQSACAQMGVDYVPIQVIPFSPTLPPFPTNKRSIFYGSTTTMYLAYQDSALRQGLFFNHETFLMENYLAQWGENMLNHGAHILSVTEVESLPYEADKLLFVRPNEDSKSFSGEVKRFGDLSAWLQQVRRSQDMSLNADTKVLIGEPYHIEKEWRLWVVEKQVVAASQYRQNFQLNKAKSCPPEVTEFAEARCQEYVPHDVFVMDIGLCGDRLYVIECGCMNSAGFYAADIEEIVRAVTGYILH